jgi:nitroreductase
MRTRVACPDLLEIMATTRAMRRLRPDPVPDEILIKLVEAATWAPNGANRQNHAFLVVTRRDQMRRLAQLWQRVADFYVAALSSRPTDTMSEAQYVRMAAAIRYQRDHFADTPAVIVACYHTTPLSVALAANWQRVIPAIRHERLRDGLTILRQMQRWSWLAEAASVYPGVQNLLLSARAYGLGATLTTWHLALEPEFKRVLGIPKKVHTFAIIPLGFPVGSFGPVRRRPVGDVLRRDFWEAPEEGSFGSS